jgi:hypothetical protein
VLTFLSANVGAGHLADVACDWRYLPPSAHERGMEVWLCLTPPWRQPRGKSISHRCFPREVAFKWELTNEIIYLPMGWLQGGTRVDFPTVRKLACWVNFGAIQGGVPRS